MEIESGFKPKLPVFCSHASTLSDALNHRFHRTLKTPESVWIAASPFYT